MAVDPVAILAPGPGSHVASIHPVSPLASGSPAHLRGFGDDGRGRAISADTPFPIGSLTKSFTALLVRQAIDAGQIDAGAPLQRVGSVPCR
jgi:CubicO group peptidase (beta-lactamase class C family)